MPPKSPITHISDTARWVAVYRAMESERPDALFRDPFAHRLAGPQGEDIVQRLPRGRQAAWSMIVRTALMDEIIMRAIRDDGIDTVLNLAAGLDTRPYRLDLPTTLHWVDADLPDILAYKQEQLASEHPVCEFESVQIDLTDTEARRALFERVGAQGSDVLILTEGLLVYLEPEQVVGLGHALHAQASFRRWLIDLASPRLLKMLERMWGKQLDGGRSPMRFGPAEGTAFFEPCGWKEIEYRPMFEESIRLQRTMPFAKLWRFIGSLYPKKKQEEFRRMSGVVLLGRIG
jgi:methyltransferase (TIGR00027 family)